MELPTDGQTTPTFTVAPNASDDNLLDVSINSVWSLPVVEEAIRSAPQDATAPEITLPEIELAEPYLTIPLPESPVEVQSELPAAEDVDVVETTNEDPEISTNGSEGNITEQLLPSVEDA